MPYNNLRYKCPKCRAMLDQYTKTLSGHMYKCMKCRSIWQIVDQTHFEKHMNRGGFD